ncbi:MAG: hypothetical protein GZ093_20555 [Rhodoferax sp.]|uniref:putative transposase n=1 Tax=Rhodoferax sp. TaxID=50421 RepID=UPI0013FEFABA|nr:hypothetical protein [Rhodoferax sp.]NDP41074.1 hypothetical protein [Rhodoferax sp.]
MGRGASHITERVAASLGELTFVAPKFQPALDVPFGGVLFALPALLALGLLDAAQDSLGKLPDGYYGLDSLLMLLTFMALARLQSMESLRYSAPGEWGKLLGLDRIPEVRTLRAKVQLLSADGQAAKWAAQLSLRWMNQDSAQSGWLYVDGHTRVYHGSQTKLPRHYVARQKLCLRATVDFWVNAMDGQPFFVVNKVVDPGLVKVIEEDIVPTLERDVPNQPSAAALAADPHLHRFTLVFDREGYSPQLWSRLKERRIAALSYHKFPGEDWATDEFVDSQVTLVNGQVATMSLAERGTPLSNGLWLREIRRLNPDGHQTAIITTDYGCDFRRLAANMMARWSQENFFKYAREHYGLDRLAGYCTQDVPDPIEVVNPAYRALDGQVRSASGKLSRSMAVFGALNMQQTIEPDHVEAFTQRKAVLKEELDALQANVISLKATRKATERRIKVKDLPEEQRFTQLSTHSKHFVDAIKMLAYRAETAMANFLRESMTRADETRTLLRELYTTEADLLPDLKNKTLTVRLHHLAQNRSDQSIALLCEELNQTKTVFPRTELQMIFEIGKPKNHGKEEI